VYVNWSEPLSVVFGTTESSSFDIDARKAHGFISHTTGGEFLRFVLFSLGSWTGLIQNNQGCSDSIGQMLHQDTSSIKEFVENKRADTV
jgi:hypothetical protein